MRLDMELEFDKYCVIDGSPTAMLPLHRQHSKKPKKRRSKGYSRYSNDVFSLKEEAIARSFNRYRSTSCTRKVSIENDEVRKRGSVYQSSKEVRLMQKTDATQERKKIELSRNVDIPFSFGIVESLCSSDEDTRRDSVMSLRSDLSTSTTSKSHIDRVKQICVGLDIGRATKVVTKDARCQLDQDSTLSYNKSLSAKLTLPHSPVCSETDSSSTSSPKKGSFDQVRRVLDPFVKSKWQRTPISSSNEHHVETLIKMKPFRKSLVHDLSNIGHRLNSPAHLQGLMKVVQRHGITFFEFSVKVPEEVYIAKIWKSDNSIDWIYTFHSSHDVRKSNASGKGSKESSKLSTMVGQMHVSCYLRTKPKNYGVSDNSMVSEFILYNVSNSRRSVDSSRVYSDVAKTQKVHDEDSVQGTHNGNVIKGQKQGRLHHSTCDNSPLTHPLAVTELLAHLQAAAIVVEAPFESRESPKLKSGDDSDVVADCARPAKVNVVIPYGAHSLPTIEENQGPSALLERWRVGGGCDCGGWDLACPLNILGNPTVHIREDLHMQNNQPLDLFIQGKKDNTASLSIRKTEEGHYEVDFHAQLSTLQAFSVSIAVLHATEPSLGFSREQKTCLLKRSDSFESFTKAEVETLVDAKKTKVSKNIRKAMTSFLVKPPFSPIARV